MPVTLPPELIELIFKTAISNDTNTALAICLTCAFGRDVARPALYHTLDLRRDGDDEVWDGKHSASKEKRMIRWSLLCRTVLGSRALVRHVRVVEAYIDNLNGPWHSVPAFTLRKWKQLVDSELDLTASQRLDIWQWLNRAYQRSQATPGKDEDATDSLDWSFTSDVYLGILVLACPYMKALRVSGDIGGSSCSFFDLVRVLKRRSRSRSGNIDAPAYPLAKAEDVEFGSGRYTLTDIECVMHWSSIKSLKATAGLPDDANYDDHPDRNLRSTLNTLHLTAVSVVNCLYTVLVSCLQLKSLHIHNIRNDCGEVDWRSLATDIVRFTPFLHDLCIGISRDDRARPFHVVHDPGAADSIAFIYTDHDLYPDTINNQGLGSLAGLKQLRKLSAPHVALFGLFNDPHLRDRDWTLDEILPTSLEELEIGCEGAEFEADDIALLYAPGTQSLRDVTIWDRGHEKWISRDHGVGIVPDPLLGHFRSAR